MLASKLTSDCVGSTVTIRQATIGGKRKVLGDISSPSEYNQEKGKEAKC
tara:strand:+ start:344 stop:490 length:147 start_codon:yes stop_codon:yes gene_type:complete